MKKFTKIISLALALVLSLGVLAACGGDKEVKLSTDVYEGDVIWVGNTAGTTGALASIGVPFNLGIESAFAEYNKNGGFNGKTVALKHYDDEGTATNSVPLMEKLIFEDEIFAVVGNYGGYAVNVNLDILKENCVPMIYAAAGIDALYNGNATTDGDRCIFPVQPLNKTEGRSLIIRAFAHALDAEGNLTGGLGAIKVGVIANQDEASKSTLAGVKLEAETLPASKKDNIVYQEVPGTDFSAAATSIVSAGCDTVIVTVTGDSFVAALNALANANFTGNVLTSYNNASADVLNNGGKLTEAGLDIMSKMTIYAQGWLDVTSTTYVYNRDTALFKTYKMQDSNLYGNGVVGFAESYWDVAEAIFNYAYTVNKGTAWAMSYNSYALAGYIAGNMFCEALKALEASGKDLTRANLVEIMETVELPVAMAGTISYANGVRTGRDMFSAAVFVDTADESFGENATAAHVAASAAFTGLQSIEELRQYITE
jgi:ABC-type branched-subunit amino acid transport system substrate-binding protein